MNNRMNSKIKALWIKALLSGKYKQGTDQLRRRYDDGSTRFCCLGVLCNLHAQAHPKIAQYETDPQTYLGRDGTLPDEVIEWAGCDLNSVRVSIGGAYMQLDAHNDGHFCKQRTFKEIANAIEKQL